MKTVSIIIVNYNTKDLLQNCLHSIYDKTISIDFEVIVIDNASKDGSVDLVKNGFKNVIIIENSINLGFGNANNLGIQIATGKYIFLLNSDTILLNNSVKILANYLDKNPEVAISGGNLYNIALKPTISFCQFMPGILNDFDIFSGGILSKILYRKNFHYNYLDKNIFINGYISGADMFIRKDILNRTGLFDSDFFMYFEETELTWRIRNMGYKIASVPEAKIIHLEGASEIIKSNTLKRFFKSKYIYFNKTGMKDYIILSFYISSITAWSRILFSFLKRNTSKTNYWKLFLKINIQEYKEYNKLHNNFYNE